MFVFDIDFELVYKIRPYNAHKYPNRYLLTITASIETILKEMELNFCEFLSETTRVN